MSGNDGTLYFNPASGPGSQPSEIDGAELDILQLPSGMSTYAAPILPEPEELVGVDEAKQLLQELLAAMVDYTTDQPPLAVDLAELDAANLDLIDQVLGEGEVSILFDGETEIKIQESVLAGVWRLKGYRGGNLVADQIEVGSVPSLIAQQTFSQAAATAQFNPQAVPPGVGNAVPLIAEINDQLAAFQQQQNNHVINLTLLPINEYDLGFLDTVLGEGNTKILSRGYGNCRISSTQLSHVWWVQYFNSQDKNILNTLEITQVPEAACAAQEDINDSSQRLREILEVYA
ncbi:hydrogenase expression/formation protein [Halioxenophilus sp. WMMB6]|uniref:hydrogenase expression/formation protein n=1 Tax=Halioxenophilus sp. WMMB6 TaxID=3073815 RepID=UPI00295EF4EC|nr:hydrogenase expression/formation protein [Halioxenophilus sp. WMMB6]